MATGSSHKEAQVAICRECKKDKLTGYQTSETKRGYTVVICDECLEKMREEIRRARNSDKPIQQHK